MIGGAVVPARFMFGPTFLVFVLLLTVGACTSEPKQEVKSEAPAAQEAKPEAQAETRPRIPVLFDPQGRLLPSEQYVVGVRLPRGAELSRQEGVRHVYRVRAPIDKVLAYFGPMMVTGNVERRGKGAVYKRASVRGAEISPTKLNVSILEVGPRVTRVSITALPPPPEYIPSSEQTKAAARDSFRMLD